MPTLPLEVGCPGLFAFLCTLDEWLLSALPSKHMQYHPLCRAMRAASPPSIRVKLGPDALFFTLGDGGRITRTDAVAVTPGCRVVVTVRLSQQWTVAHAGIYGVSLRAVGVLVTQAAPSGVEPPRGVRLHRTLPEEEGENDSGSDGDMDWGGIGPEYT